MPLEVITTNMQMNSKNVRHVCYDICRTSGIKGYYRGSYNTILGKTMFQPIFFLSYEKLKEKNYNYAVSSYLAAALGSTICNPFYVLKTREQISLKKERLIKTLRRGDFGVLYKGLFLSLILNFELATSLPIYEYSKTKLNDFNINGSFNIFLSSFLAKLLASSLFFPINTIRIVVRNSISNLSVAESFYKIKSKAGYKSFYSGFLVYSIRSVPANIITFMVYEWCKKHF